MIDGLDASVAELSRVSGHDDESACGRFGEDSVGHVVVERLVALRLNGIELELAGDGQGPALRLRQAVANAAVPGPQTPEQRVVDIFATADAPLSQRQIRERAATRPATVAKTLQDMVRDGRVQRAPEGGHRIAADAAHRRGPLPPPIPRQGG